MTQKLWFSFKAKSIRDQIGHKCKWTNQISEAGISNRHLGIRTYKFSRQGCLRRALNGPILQKWNENSEGVTELLWMQSAKTVSKVFHGRFSHTNGRNCLKVVNIFNKIEINNLKIINIFNKTKIASLLTTINISRHIFSNAQLILCIFWRLMKHSKPLMMKSAAPLINFEVPEQCFHVSED